MSIDLRKSVIDLSKKARIEIENKSLANVKSQVVLVLDISRSMNALFKNGVVQNLVQRILALALNFDDDESVDVILFGTKAYQVTPATLENLDSYVDKEILSQYKIVEATKYATALELIYEKYKNNQGDPVFVIFVTDGNNSDKKDTTQMIIKLSCESIFFQFVGIGKETFPYLNKLDDLPGRFLDNAGFMHVNDIAVIDDSTLYSHLLNEYPDWLDEASKKGVLSQL